MILHVPESTTQPTASSQPRRAVHLSATQNASAQLQSPKIIAQRVLNHPLTLGATWLMMRFILLKFALTDFSRYVATGDVFYYHGGLGAYQTGTLNEYPAMGLLPAYLVYQLFHENPNEFLVGFIGICLIADALFTILLVAWKKNILGAWFWIFAGTATLQMQIFRLDIFPAIAVGVAAIALWRHPSISALLLAVATAMKLWPGVLLVGLVRSIKSSSTWLAMGCFLGGLVAICNFIAMTFGWERLISPLSYQEERGLQVESVAATLPMLRAILGQEPGYAIFMAASKSYEITGAGVSTAIAISNLVMLVTLLIACGWALYHAFRGIWSPESTVAVWILIIACLIASNKVFSPQYMLWLTPLVAVGCARLGHMLLMRIIAVLTLLTTALTTLIFPYLYFYVVEITPDPSGVLALATRNFLLCLIVVCSAVFAVQMLSRRN